MDTVLAALGGGGDPAATGPVPGGLDLPPSMPDPEAAAAPPVDGGPGGAPPASDEVGTLKDMLGLSDAYLQLPTVTEQERAKMQKVTTVIQELLASNEKMAEQVSGAQPALRKLFG